jgi:Flp pilus assembly protein TadG
MRVRERNHTLKKRFDDESGATAVMLVVLLVVIIGMLALSIDGGLLWTKYRRVRNANDAASLAAAYSCATGETLATANQKADQVAQANVAGAATVAPTEYSPACDPNGGTVTVRYGSSQVLEFGPAVGVSSPKPVVAQATAVWGGAGGSKDVVPLVLLRDRLSTCNVVPQPGKPTPPIGTLCGFWWDNGSLGSATWGYMTLSSWGTDSAPTGCSSSGGTSDITDAITKGLTDPLLLEPTPPTYVCVKTGAPTQPVDKAIQQALAAGRTDFAMPVNDPALQINSTCKKSGCIPPPYKYAIIGFAFLKPVDIYGRNEAGYQQCAGVIPDGGNDANSFCLVASWQGYSTDGLYPRGGQNFGLTAIGLQQ